MSYKFQTFVPPSDLKNFKTFYKFSKARKFICNNKNVECTNKMNGYQVADNIIQHILVYWPVGKRNFNEIQNW